MSFPYLAALSYRAVFTEYVSTKTFRIGQLGMTEDGSQWRLSKAEAALTNTTRAQINGNTSLSGVTGDNIEAALSAALVVGDVTATVLDTNTRAKDYYKDGYFASPSASFDGTHHIWKSDAGAGTSVKVYLSEPIGVAQGIQTVELYAPLFGNINMPQAIAQGYEHFTGCINIPITTGYYFWQKVRGPHWIAPNSTWPGAATEDREAVFHLNGTIKMLDEAVNTGGISSQRAGWVMSSGNYGNVLICLALW